MQGRIRAAHVHRRLDIRPPAVRPVADWHHRRPSGSVRQFARVSGHTHGVCAGSVRDAVSVCWLLHARVAPQGKVGEGGAGAAAGVRALWLAAERGGAADVCISAAEPAHVDAVGRHRAVFPVVGLHDGDGVGWPAAVPDV